MTKESMIVFLPPNRNELGEPQRSKSEAVWRCRKVNLFTGPALVQIAIGASRTKLQMKPTSKEMNPHTSILDYRPPQWNLAKQKTLLQ